MKKLHFYSVLYLLMLCFGTVSLFGQPSVGGYNVYYGSLHNHSNVSDGSGTPAQAYNCAKNTAHLDFFGLADHSWMITSTEWTTTRNAANTYNQDGVFAAFYGFEWTSYLSYGHVTVVQTDDYCSASGSTSSFSGLISWVNNRSGIAFFNHPGWDGTAWTEFNHFTDTPSEKFVGMELWNDNDDFSKYYYNDGYYRNDGNKGYFDEALVRDWKIGAAGSDDNHDADWGTATDYRVGVLANQLTRNDILDAFRARRFFATLDKNISLSFTINNAEMGSTIPGGTWNMVIEAGDGENETFSEVVLIKNGTVYPSLGGGVKPVIQQLITCSDGDYYYVRVRQFDGDEAISSPIFISGSVNQPPVVSISSPADNTSFNTGETIPISATASDNDGQIARVEFYQGTQLLGTDTSSPFEYQWNNVSTGNYILTAKAFDNLGAVATSQQVHVTVAQPVTIVVESTVSAGNDDAEEYSKGTVILNSDDIDLVYDSKTSGNQTVGLLFRNLQIPPGASISKAWVQFTALKRTTNACNLVILGELNNSPSDFTTSAQNLSLRSKTLARITWVPATWKTVGSRSTAQQTPDISNIIQEIISLSGWSSPGKMVLLITGSGTRTAASYESLTGIEATLHVEYISSAGATAEAIKKAAHTDPKSTSEIQLISSGQLVVYPNPVHSLLTVRINGAAGMERIRVWSVSGELVMEKKISGKVQEAVLDCSLLVPGAYILSAETGNGLLSSRFIRQ